MSEMDLDRICRLCATKGEVLFPIFTNSDIFDETEPYIKIQTCAPVQISQHDGLPTMMCSNCKDKLDEAYSFRMQILTADQNLKSRQTYTPEFEWDCASNHSTVVYEEVKTETVDCIEEEVDSDDLPRKIGIKIKKHLKPRLSELCPVCGKMFPRNSFSDHMTNVHNSDANIECNICGFKVKTKRTLWHHKKLKHERINVECVQCGKVFTNTAGLRTHINNIHLGIKKHNCTLCDKSFCKKQYLTAHMRSHTGERPFSCPFCSFAFTERWNLKQHIRLHTKEKPYKCQFCDEAFYQNVVLKAHIRKKHP